MCKYYRKRKPLIVPEEYDRFYPDRLYQLVYHSGTAEQLPEYPRQQDPGDKVRKIDERLDRPFNEAVADLVEQYRKCNRNEHAEYDLPDRHSKRVFYRLHKARHRKKRDEIFRPDPFGSHDPFCREVFLECYQYPEHGDIIKEEKQKDRNGQHQVKGPVHFEPSAAEYEIALFSLSDRPAIDRCHAITFLRRGVDRNRRGKLTLSPAQELSIISWICNTQSLHP